MIDRCTRVLLGSLLVAAGLSACGSDDAGPACGATFARDPAGACTPWRAVRPYRGLADGPLLDLPDGRIAALEHERAVYDIRLGQWKAITTAPFEFVDGATVFGARVMTQGRSATGEEKYVAIWDPIDDRWSARRDTASTAATRLYPIPGGVLAQGAVGGATRFWILREAGDTLALADPIAAEDPPPQLVASNGAAALPDGHVLFIGGADAASAQVFVFDAASGHFAPGAALPVPLARSTALALRSGDALVLGGVGSDGAPSGAVARYTASAGTWRALASMPTPMIAPTAIELTDGAILALGGQTSSAQRYDPVADRWDAIALPPIRDPAPALRGWPAAALPDGRALAEIDRTTYVYDPAGLAATAP